MSEQAERAIGPLSGGVNEARPSGERRTRCDCCRAWSTQPTFAINAPVGGRARRICRRCASHVSLKADGDLWMPATCPDAPRARLRVFHRLDESERDAP